MLRIRNKYTSQLTDMSTGQGLVSAGCYINLLVVTLFWSIHNIAVLRYGLQAIQFDIELNTEVVWPC